MDKNSTEFVTKVLARDARTAKYPVDYGKFEKLNDKGQQIVQMLLASGAIRAKLNKSDADAKWKTFRDGDPSLFKSIFTGTPAASLPGHWLDLKAPPGEPTKIDTVK